MYPAVGVAAKKLMTAATLLQNDKSDEAKKAKKEWEKDALQYAKSVNMNPANTDALLVLGTQGPAAMIKKISTIQDASGNQHQLSYAEMRAMYG